MKDPSKSFVTSDGTVRRSGITISVSDDTLDEIRKGGIDAGVKIKPKNTE